MTKAPPTIVILDGSIAVTGAFISARDMARTLCKDSKVCLLLPYSATIAHSELSDFNTVDYLAIHPLRRTVKDAALYLPRLIRATWHLKRFMDAHPQALLMTNDFYLIQGPLLRMLGHQGPVLTWVRIDPAAFGRVGQLWLTMAHRYSSRLIAVSRHIQNLLSDQYPSELLYDPVSNEFLPLPEKTMPETREFVLVGNYITGKGQDLALEAFARLLVDVPHARLRFCGGDMGLARNRIYRSTLEARANALGITDKVIFDNFSPNPRTVLNGAFAALNLSRSESFSRTVLEASASGIPVISTCSGGPSEIIADGETGIMIPIGDIEACVIAMRTLCNNPERAAKMGRAGRARVLTQFSQDLFSTRLRSLIAEVAEACVV